MTFRELAERVPGTWALFAARHPSGDAVVAWAGNAMVAGLDGRHLRRIAACASPTSWFEVEVPLRRSLEELGLSHYPTRQEAGWVHAAEIARRVLSRATPVPRALDEFYRTILVPLEYPFEFETWWRLCDDIDPARPHLMLLPDRRDALAFGAAENLLLDYDVRSW